MGLALQEAPVGLLNRLLRRSTPISAVKWSREQLVGTRENVAQAQLMAWHPSISQEAKNCLTDLNRVLLHWSERSVWQVAPLDSLYTRKWKSGDALTISRSRNALGFTHLLFNDSRTEKAEVKRLQ